MRKKTSKSMLAIVLAVLFVCSGYTIQAAAQNVPGVTDDTITVGGIVDMTGPVASTLAPYCTGTKDYIKMVNDNGGVHGRKIVWKWEDDQWKVAKALAAFRKLNEEGIFALLSQVGSSQFAAMDPEITEAKQLVVGPGQTTGMIENNPYTYATMLSYLDMGSIMVKRAVDSFKGPGKPNVAIFSPHGSSSVDFADACRNAAKKLGAPVVMEEVLPYSTSEMASQVAKLKQNKANVVVFLANGPLMTVLLRDLARMGATQDIRVIGGFSSNFPTVFETVGKQASSNFEGIHCYTPATGEGPGVELMRKTAVKYQTPQGTYTNLTYSQGWMTGLVFVEGLKRTGRNLNRDSYMKAIESIKDLDTGGMSYPLTYGKNKVCTKTARFYSYDFNKKSFEPTSDWYDAKLN